MTPPTRSSRSASGTAGSSTSRSAASAPSSESSPTPTRAVSASSARLPTQFQAYVPGQDVRVHVVGEDTYAGPSTATRSTTATPTRAGSPPGRPARPAPGHGPALRGTRGPLGLPLCGHRPAPHTRRRVGVLRGQSHAGLQLLRGGLDVTNRPGRCRAAAGRYRPGRGDRPSCKSSTISRRSPVGLARSAHPTLNDYDLLELALERAGRIPAGPICSRPRLGRQWD